AHGERAGRPTVIAALQRDDLVLAGLAGGEPVVPRHLHRALVGLGAADREERVVEIARREAGDLGGQLGGGTIRELASRRIVGQAHGLLGDRLGDLPPAVAHVDDREAGEAVDELLAALGPHVDALGALDDELLVGEPGMVLRLVGPEMPDRVAARGHGCASPLWPDAIILRVFIIGIDVGGTFTDLTAVDDATGRVVVTKVPSQARNEAAAVLAGLEALGIAGRDVKRLVHGTTVGTNAVLERRGARVALLPTPALPHPTATRPPHPPTPPPL